LAENVHDTLEKRSHMRLNRYGEAWADFTRHYRPRLEINGDQANSIRHMHPGYTGRPGPSMPPEHIALLAILTRRQRREEGASMDEQYVTHIVLQQYRSSSSYSERETAAASHLGIGAIRHLHAMGLIEGKEAGGEMCYSEEEVIQLRLIRCLQRDLGINLAGVEVILHLLKRLEVLQLQLERERNREYGDET